MGFHAGCTDARGLAPLKMRMIYLLYMDGDHALDARPRRHLLSALLIRLYVLHNPGLPFIQPRLRCAPSRFMNSAIPPPSRSTRSKIPDRPARGRCVSMLPASVWATSTAC